jgi:hypothetical protein
MESKEVEKLFGKGKTKAKATKKIGVVGRYRCQFCVSG